MIVFFKNKNIYYLPEQVGQKFPNLVGYYADGCSILAVDRVNFQDIPKLESLVLSGNRLVSLPANVFFDLKALKEVLLREFLIKFFLFGSNFILSLEKNKILFFTGDAFGSLTNLAMLIFERKRVHQ